MLFMGTFWRAIDPSKVEVAFGRFRRTARIFRKCKSLKICVVLLTNAEGCTMEPSYKETGTEESEGTGKACNSQGCTKRQGVREK